MSLGIVGQKEGMTRIFTEDGESQPVTVIKVEPNRITQIKSESVDGYSAVQVTTGTQHRNRLDKATSGVYEKAGITPGTGLWEFTLEEDNSLEIGGTISVADIFEIGQKVDVSGTTIGKGFAGGVKRYGFRGGDATHGNSLAHRLPGSIGQCQTPGRVFKGKRMAGHMGNAKRTVQNLEVVRIDNDKNLMLVKGAVPGSKGGDLIITRTTRV